MRAVICPNLARDVGVYIARRWASQAKEMLLNSPESKQISECFVDLMVDRLVVEMGLTVFLGSSVSSKGNEARASLRNYIILPALELQDKFMCSIDKYALEINHYRHFPWGNTPDFTRDLQILNCKNFGQGLKRFRPDKMQEKPTEEEIRKRLRMLCATTPALVLRETQDRQFGPPITLVKQEILVVWTKPGATVVADPVVVPDELRGLFWMLFRSFHVKQPEKTDGQGQAMW